MNPKSLFRALKTPGLLFCVIAANRLVGLIRSLILAKSFGVGADAAALELATRMTSSLYEGTVGALIAVMFIPAYTARKEASLQKADRFTQGLLLSLLAVGILLYVPFLFFPKACLLTVAKIPDAVTLAKAASALRFLSLGNVTISLSTLLTGVLQSDRRPLLPALIYFFSTFASIPCLFLFGKTISAESFSLLLLILDLLVFLTLLAFVLKKHRPLKVSWYFPKAPASFLGKAAGVMLFSSSIPLAALLSAAFLSRLGGNEATAAGGYALKWILLVAALLFSAFHGVYYPILAKEKEKALRIVKKPLLLLLGVASLFTAVLFLLGRPLFAILYGGPSFSENGLALTQKLLLCYTPAIPLLVLSALFNDLAYLLEKTKILATASLVALVFNCLTVWFLSPHLSFYAVPLGFILSFLLRLSFAAFSLFKRKKKGKSGRLKLMLVLSDANVGGAGRQLLSYLSGADRERFSITAVLPPHAELAPYVEKTGIPLLFCGKERSFSPSAILAYYRLFRKERPHILHANAALSARIAAFLARVPVRVYTRHSVFPTAPLFRHALPRGAVRCATALLSTGVIAVAKEAADNLYDMGVSRKQVVVIENGVMPLTFSSAARSEIRKSLLIDENETVAVICGRLEPDKDVATLLRALAIARKKEENLRLLILGKGSEDQALKALAHDLSLENAVHFCGFVSDVAPYLSAADCYVNCSVGTEATSLAIAEAMSLSLPIIATDYGGNPHMVKDGHNGILVPQRCPETLADALIVMTDPTLRQYFGKASYQVYTARYSATRMAKRNEAFYRNLFIRKGYPMP